MESCNNSALDWFAYPALYLEQCSDSWPWANITVGDWRFVIEQLQRPVSLQSSDPIVFLTIAPLGIIGSICSVVSLWRKAVVNKEHFYIWMLLVALMDLIFNMCSILYALSYDTQFSNIYKYSYDGTVFSIVLYGLMAGSSLAADLCALALAMERYWAICKPASGHPLFNGKRVKVGAVVLIGLMSTVRAIRYGQDYTTSGTLQEANETTDDSVTSGYYTYEAVTVAPSTGHSILIFFTDVVLPFVLFALMVYFSSRLAIAILLRAHRRVHDSHVPDPRSEAEQTALMLELLIILVILFTSNQLGYCLYAVGFVMLSVRGRRVSFESSFEVVMAYAKADAFSLMTSFISVVFELLSRSLNFFLYYVFSKSIRAEFLKALGRA